MTNDEFAAQLIALTQTLYRVSCAQLSQAADREDAVQEALRKAWEKRGSLRDENALKPWLIPILINECHTLQRRAARVIPAESIEHESSEENDTLALREALLSLPEKLRMPLVLRYMEQMHAEEIASVLRVPVSTVRSRIQRAKKILRERLGEEAEA